MFLLWLRQLPQCGDSTPASVPPPTEGSSIPTNTPDVPTSSFILPSFAWFYIFISTSQVLLSTLSWCFARNSVSKAVFLMYPWRNVLHIHLFLSHILYFVLWSQLSFLKIFFSESSWLWVWRKWNYKSVWMQTRVRSFQFSEFSIDLFLCKFSLSFEIFSWLTSFWLTYILL